MQQGEVHEQGDVNADVYLLARQTLTDVVNMTLKVKQAIGSKRLQTAAQVAEFLRVIVGSDVSRVRRGVAIIASRAGRNLSTTRIGLFPRAMAS